jgi:predicted nuclease of predicted toxin-antitoxin system
MIVADESVDGNIVAHLKTLSYQIHYIPQHTPGIPDLEVLETAIQNDALLLTEDKDFGELVYRLRLPHCGILLLRLAGVETSKKCSLVEFALRENEAMLKNKFAVLDENKLRIREIKKG